MLKSFFYLLLAVAAASYFIYFFVGSPERLGVSWLVNIASPKSNSAGTQQSGEQIQHYDDIKKELLRQIKPGDIILRTTNEFTSSVIKNLFNSADVEATHVAIVVPAAEDGSFDVIHTIGDDNINRIRQNSLEEFVNRAQRGSVQVVRARDEYAGGKGVVRLARQYLATNASFDYSFDHHDDTRVYCSELPYLVLQQLTDKISFQFRPFAGKRIITFASFLDPRFFQIVYK